MLYRKNMDMKNLAYLFLCAALIAVSGVNAAVKLPSVFSDGMVLQQQSKVALWGKAIPGATVSIQTSWNKNSYSVKAKSDSTWRVSVVTGTAGGPYEIRIGEGGKSLVVKDVLLGEVWLASGQSNMEMPLKGFKAQPVNNSEEIIRNSENNLIRFFDVANVSWRQPMDDCGGKWLPASPVNTVNFSATAYLYALNLYRLLHIPVGIIESDWGGTPVEAWMSRKALTPYSQVAVPEQKNDSNSDKKTPAGLYNAMIHPIAGYGIKGVIWYQGEQNRDDPALYAGLFPAMVSQWRSEWGIGEFPFYYVQIAPYLFKRTTNIPDNMKQLAPKVPVLREVQMQCEQKIKNCGMAVLTDAGEQTTIHPADKQTVAERLFLIAKARTYGYADTKYKSPSYANMTKGGNKIILHFRNTEGGLKFKNNVSSNFEIAGPDKVFHQAKAEIQGDAIVVYSDDVSEPEAVRYAFQAWVVGDLYNLVGLPASSFRTDNWEINK
jgi:sialate O-acetylesterase